MKTQGIRTVGRAGARVRRRALALGLSLGLLVPALWAAPAPAQDDCCGALVKGVRKDVNGIGDQLIQMRTKLGVLGIESCCRNHVRAIQVGARSVSLEVSQLKTAAEKAGDQERVKLCETLAAQTRSLDSAVSDLADAHANADAEAALSDIARALDGMATALDKDPALQSGAPGGA